MVGVQGDRDITQYIKPHRPPSAGSNGGSKQKWMESAYNLSPAQSWPWKKERMVITRGNAVAPSGFTSAGPEVSGVAYYASFLQQ